MAVLRGTLFRHLFRFDVLDGIFIVGIYALGSYMIIDVPVDVLIFAAFYALTASPRLGFRRFVYAFLVYGLATLTLTGIAFYFFGKFTAPNLYLRMFHQIGSRFIFLTWLPYLLILSRTPMQGRPARDQWLFNFGILFFKLSIYAGLIMAGLSNFGGLIDYHIILLLAAIPCLAPTILRAAPPTAEAPPPFSIRLIARKRETILALAAALATIAFLVCPSPTTPGFFADTSAFRLPGKAADFSPSPFRSATGHYYRPEYLARSNGCGVRACHPSVLGEWTLSKHRFSTGPDYQQMLEEVVRECGAPAARVCAACHDPISLLAGQVDYGRSFDTPEGLREGISCLVCHSLFAVGDQPANGALEFCFPEYFYLSPLSLLAMVAVADEHRLDFAAAGYRDDRLCVACHRIQPLAGEEWRKLDKWLLAPIHGQPDMRPECRGEKGCLDCHMPKSSDAERPGPSLADHRFPVKPTAPAIESPNAAVGQKP